MRVGLKWHSSNQRSSNKILHVYFFDDRLAAMRPVALQLFLDGVTSKNFVDFKNKFLDIQANLLAMRPVAIHMTAL